MFFKQRFDKSMLEGGWGRSLTQSQVDDNSDGFDESVGGIICRWRCSYRTVGSTCSCRWRKIFCHRDILARVDAHEKEGKHDGIL